MPVSVEEVKKVERLETTNNLVVSKLSEVDNYDDLCLKYPGLDQYSNVEEIKTDEDGDLIINESTPKLPEIKPIQFPDLETKEDGFMGIPQFTQLDLDALKRIGIDIESVSTYEEMMKDAVENKKEIEATIENLSEDDEDIKVLYTTSLDNAIFNYHHARNFLILYKIGAKEFTNTVKDGVDEILAGINKAIEESIHTWASEPVEHELVLDNIVTFNGKNFLQYLTYKTLNRLQSLSLEKNFKDDFIYKLMKSKTPKEFESLVLKSLNNAAIFISNLQQAHKLDKVSADEQKMVKNFRSIVSYLRHMNTNINCDFVAEDNETRSIGQILDNVTTDAEKMCSFILLNLNNLEGTTAYAEFKEEKRKHSLEVKRLKKDNKKYYGNSKFHENTPFNDSFIRKRLVAMFTDMQLLKKYFTGSLLMGPDKKYNEHDLLNNVDTLKEAYDAKKADGNFYGSVIKAIVATFFYHYLFEEMKRISDIFKESLTKVTDVKINVKSSNDFKRLRHYLYITLFDEKNTDENKYFLPYENLEEGADIVIKYNQTIQFLYQRTFDQFYKVLANWDANLEKFA